MITELSALTSINFSVAIIGIQRSRFLKPKISNSPTSILSSDQVLKFYDVASVEEAANAKFISSS